MATRSSPPRIGPSHKERLLEQGIKQFYTSGFHGTSVDRVLEEAGVPKGSFYHHFGSKEAFALAVLNAYHERQQARLTRWMNAADLDACEKLHGYVKELTQAFKKGGCRRGCLVGKFSLELAATSETFASLLTSMLTSWKASIERIIIEGQHSGAIRADIPSSQLADMLLASIQGALVLDLAHRHVGAMESVEASVPAILRPVTPLRRRNT